MPDDDITELKIEVEDDDVQGVVRLYVKKIDEDCYVVDRASWKGHGTKEAIAHVIDSIIQTSNVGGSVDRVMIHNRKNDHIQVLKPGEEIYINDGR